MGEGLLLLLLAQKGRGEDRRGGFDEFPNTNGKTEIG